MQPNLTFCPGGLIGQQPASVVAILSKDDDRAPMWIFYLIIGLWASSVVLEFLFADDGPRDISSYIHRPNLDS